MECIIFIGAPASGKSSFYKERFCDSHIRINLDMLRTRHRESLLVQSCVAAKQSVVIDNTNPSIEDRERYIHLFKENHFEIIGYYFQSRIEDCLKRNKDRDEQRRIPDVGVRSVYAKLAMPTFAEGFDQLFFVSMNNNSFDVTDWEDDKK